MKNTFDTIVAGITKNNKAGKDRQKILKSYVKENYDYDRFDKDGGDYWSPQDIREFEWEVYQYEMYEDNTIELMPEPDNTYDKNAIKVVHKVMGDLGYIPKKDNLNLANFIELSSGNISLSFELEGGRYKYYDGEKIITDTKPYGLRIYVKSLTTKENSISDKEFINYEQTYEYAEKDIFSNLADSSIETIQEEKNITKPKKQNNASKKSYLIATCISILASLISLVTGQIIGLIIMVILTIIFISGYIEKNKEEKNEK